MTDRECLEMDEDRYLRLEAARSASSRGRVHQESPCPWRTDFQRDRDRILHAKAFRRLGHKTQVFVLPEGDHYRSRLTHTLEVTQVARTISRLLKLNGDLTEAIALGHDLGHTPFGHAGESALNILLPDGFRHNEQSLRVVELLERTNHPYSGLNLTWEVRDGLLKHTGSERPVTWEGEVVRLADRIAYLNHDVDDAIRGGLIAENDLPSIVLTILGNGHSSRLTAWVSDVVEYSRKEGRICQSPELAAATECLRDFLFSRVYIASLAKKEEAKVALMLTALFEYFMLHPQEVPDQNSGESSSRRVADYIAGMTDRFAVSEFNRNYVPSCWEG